MLVRREKSWLLSGEMASIKTRIETKQRKGFNVHVEQVGKWLPSKQGLKLYILRTLGDERVVGKWLPSKQGLKHQRIERRHEAGSCGEMASIKTRIETANPARTIQNK